MSVAVDVAIVVGAAVAVHGCRLVVAAVVAVVLAVAVDVDAAIAVGVAVAAPGSGCHHCWWYAVADHCGSYCH